MKFLQKVQGEWAEKHLLDLLDVKHLMTFQKMVSQRVEVEAILEELNSECMSKK